MRRIAASIASLIVLGAAPLARAGKIVLMTDPDDAAAQHAALQVALHDTEITTLPPPEGALQLDRVASVEHGVAAAGADVGIWIEIEPTAREVCVVSADGKVLRHAPLPPDGSPRAFAAIATSLVDELLEPPDVSVSVDVHVDVKPPRVAVAAPPVIAPPSVVAPVPAPVVERGPRLAIGAMVSPLTVGGEAELSMPFGSHAVGLMAAVNTLVFEKYIPVYIGGLEVSKLGTGPTHFDYGMIFGGAEAQGYGVVIIAARFGWVWERDGYAIGASFSPTVFIGDGVAGPALWGSLRMELPL